MSERDDARATRDLLAALAEPESHLDFDAHLAPYADGTIGAAEREIVESHVEDCEICRAELHDLLRHARGARPRTAWLVAAASLVIVVAAAVVALRGRAPRPSPAPVTASIARPAPPAPYADAEWARLVEESLRSGRLPAPLIAPPTRGADDTLRGATAPRETLRPSGVVLDTTRPALEWPATSGASYVVSIFSGGDEVARSKRLAAPRWTVDRDLPRGRAYQWQVEVRKGNASRILPAVPAPPPAFRILGTREHDDLERARAQHGDDALLLAVLSARYGLADDARRHLGQLSGSPDPRVQSLVMAEKKSGGA